MEREESDRDIGANQLASWNRQLSLQRARGMGQEFRTKGVNVFLGPVVSPLGRTVTGGRNWEGKPETSCPRHVKKARANVPFRNLGGPLLVWCSCL